MGFGRFTGRSQEAPSTSAALPLAVGMNGQQMRTVIDPTSGFFLREKRRSFLRGYYYLSKRGNGDV